MAEERLGEALTERIAEWNEGSGTRYPPPTDKVAYVLLSTPAGVSLHYAMPRHGNGLEATVRRRVHPGWLA